MTLQLPAPVPLDLPREDPAALEELAAAVTGAAFHLGLLGVHLTAPAASVRDWVGRDAAAASAQVGVLAGLVRDERDAVSAAAARIEAHAGRVRDTVARVRALRAAQHEEFAAAVHRLCVLVGGPVDGAAVEPPEAVAVVADWRSAEAHRLGQHAAVLAELTEDAAATARVLAGCTAVVGGTGAPGDDGRVLRHLAQTLPGWGDREMAGRGHALAAALSAPVTLGRVDELARSAAEWVGVPAYADALLAGLGVGGVRWLLSIAGDDVRGAASPVAAALAGALGAARPGGPGADPAGVLSARYVTADDRDGAADVLVLGMGAVLGAGLRSGAGPAAPVVAAWGAQALARERAQQASAQERVPRAQAAGEDPVGLVVQVLARAQDGTAAARLLAAPDAFAALLARTWAAGPDDLAVLVRLAASAAGPEGAAAARAGLAALGEGLAPGSAGTWTVQRPTAAAVVPGLLRALTAHAGVVSGLLSSAGTAGPPLAPADDAALRGLGFLTLDGAAAAALGDALAERLRAAAATPGAGPATAELGAFVAVQQYGQRLAHALAAAAAQSHAVDRSFLFQEVLSPLRVVEETKGLPDKVQVPLDIGLDTVAHLLRLDGSWTIGPDPGAAFSRADAVARVRTAAGTGTEPPVGAAATAYDTVLARLGAPTGPPPPTWSWLQMIEGDLPDPLDLTPVKRKQHAPH